MRLSVILLLLSFQVSARNFAQQFLTLKENHATIAKVFKQIEKHSSYLFYYSNDVVPVNKIVSINVTNATINDVLYKIFEDERNISWKVMNDNKIVITEKEINIPIPNKPVKGVVKNEKGELLENVSVVIKGSAKGVVTSANGEFIIEVPNDNTILQISMIGYETKDVAIKGNSFLNIVLAVKERQMEEVIVTGYSRQNKKDVTGAATVVGGDLLNKAPVSDVGAALQGRVAGVMVDEQGGPGNSASIRIRGVGTLGDNDPLYVIDGVQIRMGKGGYSQDIANLLNTGDIESITVLKDPSLTSLYGAEGANGVIVITTKSGKKGEPKLEYNAYIADQFSRKLPSMITPQQQADALYQSYINTNQSFPYTGFYGTGSTPVLPDYIIESSTPNVGISANDPQADASLYSFTNYRILKANKSGTNWWRTLFKPSVSQNHQLTISGATDNSNYAITFNYNDDKGNLLNSYFKRYSLRANTEFKLKPWLRIGENFEFAYTSTNTLSNSDPYNSFNNNISGLYAMPGLLPEYDIKGHVSGLNGASVLGGQVLTAPANPLIDRLSAVNAHNYTEGIIGSAYAELEPVKGLTYQSKIGIQYIPGQYHSFSDTTPQNPIPSTTSYFYEGSNYYTDWRWTNKIAYTHTFKGVHKVSAFAVYEARKYDYRWISATVDDLTLTNTNFQYLNNGSANSNFPPKGSGASQSNISQLYNVNYSYADKYFLSGSIRHDGSSIFGSSSRYGTFPSFSAGWRISREKFMENVNWVNDLKLRGSWGKVGNDAIPPSQQYSLIQSNQLIYGGYDLTGSNTNQIIGLYLSQYGNANLHWETNQTTNIGFDAALLKNAITIGFNWFNRKTKDLLYQPPYPGTGGAASAPYKNIMSFTNKGIELEIGYRGGSKHGISYDMSFNISGYKSNVDYIDGNPATFIESGQYMPTSFYLARNMVGHPVSEFYGYVYNGIYQNATDVQNSAAQSGVSSSNGTGHFKFKDLTGNNNIDDSDRTFIGNPNPKFSYGYNLNISYKNFDLALFIQGVYGNKIFNYWRAYATWPGSFTTGSLDTWTSSNTKAKLPIYTQDGLNTSNDNLPSTFFIENGSYLRLKSIQLGYTFPKNKIYNRLRVYVQAYNVLTITKYSGLDPAVNVGDPGSLGIDFGTQYPISMKLIFGINLSL